MCFLPRIRPHQRIVVGISVIAKYGRRIDETLSYVHMEAVSHQHGVGEHTDRSAVTIVEGVYPRESMVYEGGLEEVVLRIAFFVYEGKQLVHIPRHLREIWWRMGRVCNGHRISPVLSGCTATFFLESRGDDGMNLRKEQSVYRVFFDIFLVGEQADVHDAPLDE